MFSQPVQLLSTLVVWRERSPVTSRLARCLPGSSGKGMRATDSYVFPFLFYVCTIMLVLEVYLLRPLGTEKHLYFMVKAMHYGVRLYSTIIK